MSKVISFVSVVLFSTVGFAKADGFYVQGKLADTAETAREFYEEVLSAQEAGDEARVCYVGAYEDAFESVHENLSISVLDVYGEDSQPALDTEVSIDDGEVDEGTIGAIISACED